MSNQRETLWARFAQVGLVRGDVPLVADSVATPWFVRVMLGVAGWIGALFLLAFFGFAFELLRDSAPAQLVVGAVVCAIAAFMFRAQPRNEFLAQFAFAISLAGQGLVLVGFTSAIKSNPAAVAVSMALVQTALFFLVANFLHRIWCAWTAALAVAFALASWHLPLYAAPLLTALFAGVWLSGGPQRAQVGARWRAGGYGLALALVQTILFLDAGVLRWLFFRGGQDVYGYAWIAGVLMAVVWFVSILLLLRREQAVSSHNGARLALLGIVIVALVTLKAPGFAPLIAMILLGFANGARVLIGLGALALLGYGMHYYYALNITLLEKSMWLAATGIALLLARQLLYRYWPTTEANAHA